MFLLLLLLVSIAYMIPGGFFECESKNSEKVKGVAAFAVIQMSKGGDHVFKLDSIERCEKQIVAGTNWRLELATEEDGTTVHYLVIVYEDLKGKYELSSTELRDGAGGWESCDDRIANGDRDLLTTVSKTIQKLNEMSNSAYTMNIRGILSCKQQVVAGMNYQFELEIGGSPDGTTEVKKVNVYEDLEENVDVTLA